MDVVYIETELDAYIPKALLLSAYYVQTPSQCTSVYYLVLQ